MRPRKEIGSYWNFIKFDQLISVYRFPSTSTTAVHSFYFSAWLYIDYSLHDRILNWLIYYLAYYSYETRIFPPAAVNSRSYHGCTNVWELLVLLSLSFLGAWQIPAFYSPVLRPDEYYKRLTFFTISWRSLLTEDYSSECIIQRTRQLKKLCMHKANRKKTKKKINFALF